MKRAITKVEGGFLVASEDPKTGKWSTVFMKNSKGTRRLIRQFKAEIAQQKHVLEQLDDHSLTKHP